MALGDVTRRGFRKRNYTEVSGGSVVDWMALSVVFRWSPGESGAGSHQILPDRCRSRMIPAQDAFGVGEGLLVKSDGLVEVSRHREFPTNGSVLLSALSHIDCPSKAF